MRRWGVFSHQASWRLHVGQNERGAETERPSGERYTTDVDERPDEHSEDGRDQDRDYQ